MPFVRSITGLQNKVSVWKLSPYDLVKESQNKKNILFQRKRMVLQTHQVFERIF